VVSLGGDVRQLSALLPGVVIDRLVEKQKKSPMASEPDAPAT
jgi:hypothetical protein